MEQKTPLPRRNFPQKPPRRKAGVPQGPAPACTFARPAVPEGRAMPAASFAGRHDRHVPQPAEAQQSPQREHRRTRLQQNSRRAEGTHEKGFVLRPGHGAFWNSGMPPAAEALRQGAQSMKERESVPCRRVTLPQCSDHACDALTPKGKKRDFRHPAALFRRAWPSACVFQEKTAVRQKYPGACPALMPASARSGD